MYEIKLKTV